MALSVTHSTVVVVPDDGTSPVGTDEWNAQHALSGVLDATNGGTGTATGISAATQTALDAKVAKAGDTMTGNLVMASSAPILAQQKTASGTDNAIYGYTGSSARWGVLLGDSIGEGGSDFGSNFAIARYSNTSSLINYPLYISRHNGDVAVNATTYVNSSLICAASSGSSDGIIYFGALANSKYLQYYHATTTFFLAASFSITGAGSKPGGGDWTDTSDARIKTVLGPYEAGLDEVLALAPVRFNYRGNDTPSPPQHFAGVRQPDTPEPKGPPEVPYANSLHYSAAVAATEYIGLIAQEVEPVMPEMVAQVAGFIDGQPVEDLRVLDTTALVYALVNSVKALAARVAALEAPNG